MATATMRHYLARQAWHVWSLRAPAAEADMAMATMRRGLIWQGRRGTSGASGRLRRRPKLTRLPCAVGLFDESGVAFRELQGACGGGRNGNGYHAPRAYLARQAWHFGSFRVPAAEAEMAMATMRRVPI
jgi:hypothetical protein